MSYNKYEMVLLAVEATKLVKNSSDQISTTTNCIVERKDNDLFFKTRVRFNKQKSPVTTAIDLLEEDFFNIDFLKKSFANRLNNIKNVDLEEDFENVEADNQELECVSAAFIEEIENENVPEYFYAQENLELENLE